MSSITFAASSLETAFFDIFEPVCNKGITSYSHKWHRLCLPTLM
jgi:hypothetical protein